MKRRVYANKNESIVISNSYDCPFLDKEYCECNLLQALSNMFYPVCGETSSDGVFRDDCPLEEVKE